MSGLREAAHVAIGPSPEQHVGAIRPLHEAEVLELQRPVAAEGGVRPERVRRIRPRAALLADLEWQGPGLTELFAVCTVTVPSARCCVKCVPLSRAL